MKPTRFFSVADVYTSYYANTKGQRLGQFIYNYFHERFPDVEVPEEVDCFYHDSRISDFLTFALSQNP